MSLGANKQALMGAAGASGGGGTTIYDYQIAKSGRFNLANSAYMYRTPSSAGNRKTWTYSTWVKRSSFNINNSFFGATNGSYQNVFRFEDTSGNDQINLFGFTGATLDFNVQTNNMYRDSSAWYHIVIAFDTTQGTSSNRVKLYVNGVQQTNLKENTYPSQNYDTNVNDTSTQTQVGYGSYGGQYFNGYIAESVLIDGTQYAASDFGETVNGVWVPKDPSGLTFGTNGFHMNYASSSALGNDVSGNNNDLTVSGLATHDQMLDTPTFNSDSNGGNFNTLNPLQKMSIGTFSEGNLKYVMSGGDNFSTTQALTTKSYCEVRIDALGNYGGALGFGSGEGINGYYDGVTFQTNYLSGALYIYKGSSDISSGNIGGVVGAGSVVMMAYDPATYKWWVGVDGTWRSSGNPATGANPIYTGSATQFENTGDVFWKGWKGGANSMTVTFNFGQDGTFGGQETAQGNKDDTGYGNFKYDVPAGFLANCTGNVLVADAIDPAQTSNAYPSKVFSAITYTGTGSEKAVAVGWQPDLTWVKERSGTNDNKLTDSVRGATKALESNTDAAETTDAQGVKAFTSTGFTLGTDAVYNNNTDTYISWNWKEGADYGLDIVAYSGSLTGSGVVNISHSLGAIPECIWHMSRSALGGAIRHQSLTSANYMMTNAASSGAGTGWGSGAQVDKSGNGNMTALGTSSTFTTNYTGILNQNGDDAVAYVWRGIEGFSKFGGYTGNANADGTFVYTGFSPAYVIIKRRDGTESYFAMDNKRVGYNVVERVMQLNGGNPESTTDYDALDFLSNGFKLRLSDAGFNGSEQYTYMAWAENPFKYATAR
tara:strand:- start:560 stop:3031 length:2472 start_codon:yes stop_codon:yes gene_type:complete